MSKRFCFIGDSHVGALRLAIIEDEASAFAGDMDIFGVRGEGLRRTMVNGRRLTSRDEEVRKSFALTGGAESIDLDGYEAFCVVGGGTGLHAGLGICGTCSTSALALPGRQLVSQELMDLMLHTRLRRSIAHRIIEILVRETGKPVYLITNPRLARPVITRPQGAQLKEMHELGVIDDFAGWLYGGMETVFAPKATILAQPASTRSGPCFTKPEFTLGSRRLAADAEEHPKWDFAHMNAAYGREVLKAFFAAVESNPPLRAAAV